MFSIPKNIFLVFVVALMVVVGCDGGADGDGGDGADFALSSPDFEDGGPLPPESACDDIVGGTEAEITVEWENAPGDTAGFAFTLIDEDADGDAAEEGYVHMVAYNIPSDVTSTDQAGFDEADFTMNDSGAVGYFPPCPPEGDPAHTYVATIYAVDLADLSTEVDDPTDADEVLAAIRANDLDSVSISGTLAAP